MQVFVVLSLKLVAVAAVEVEQLGALQFGSEGYIVAVESCILLAAGTAAVAVVAGTVVVAVVVVVLVVGIEVAAAAAAAVAGNCSGEIDTKASDIPVEDLHEKYSSALRLISYRFHAPFLFVAAVTQPIYGTEFHI